MSLPFILFERVRALVDLAHEKIHGITVVVAPAGPLDATTVNGFMAGIKPILEGSTNMVLDLSSVTHIDSPGLVTLLSCLRHLSAKGGDLKLFGVNGEVTQVIQSVGMQRLIDIYDARDNALNAFAPSPA